MKKFYHLFVYLSVSIMAHAAEQEKVVIVGAGFAGLTAAYRLYQKGVAVEVYEARPRVGGRVFSVNVLGASAELGGQNIRDGGRAENLLALASELDLEIQSTRQPFQPIYLEGDELYDFKKLADSCHFDKEHLREMLCAKAQGARNMQELLAALFRPDTILYKACQAMLEGYEGGCLNQLSICCASTLYHLLMGAVSASHSESDEIENLSIHGGNGLFAEKIAALMGDKVHLNHALTAIDKEKDGSYRLTFKEGKTITADRVILTIPCPVYKDLVISEAVITKEKQAAITALPMGTTAKIITAVEPAPAKGYLTEYMTLFNRADSPIVTLYYRNKHASFTQDTLFEKFQMGLALIETIYKLENRFTPLLAKETSFASYEAAVGHSWPLDPFAQGSYSYIPAGQEEAYTSMIEIENETVKALFAPIDNTLFFAGEHTCIDLNICGTMEAAVESGERTARLLLKCMTKR